MVGDLAAIELGLYLIPASGSSECSYPRPCEVILQGYKEGSRARSTKGARVTTEEWHEVRGSRIGARVTGTRSNEVREADTVRRGAMRRS